MYIKGVQMWTLMNCLCIRWVLKLNLKNLNFPLHLVGLANYTIYIKNCKSFAQAIKKEEDGKIIRQSAVGNRPQVRYKQNLIKLALPGDNQKKNR